MFEPKTEREAIEFCKSAKNFIVLGKGSNTLLPPRVESVLHFGKNFEKTKINGNIIDCQSGKSVVSLAKQAAEFGLSGLEFACGIPASIGGAIAMNAGAFGSDFSQIIKEVTAYDCDLQKTFKISNYDCEFGYRTSIFNEKLIILSAKLELQYKNPNDIKQTMRQNLQKRKQTQPIDKFSLGSVFLSDKYPVAKMIDELNLKGTKIGDAEISIKHSGFITNNGNATQKDIINLIEFIKRSVYKKYGIKLKEEIRILE